MIKNILSYIQKTILEEEKEKFFEFQKEIHEVIKAVVESILFQDGIDFLDKSQFISCFKDDKEKDFFEHINTVLFLTYGKEKINGLFNLLAEVIYTWNIVDTDKYLGSPKKPYEFYKKYKSGKFDDYFLIDEIIYLSDMISQYEETVKKIDKNQIGEILIVK